MLNISHLYKSLLSKDIEININSKIENIKNANKWSDFNVKSACDKIDFTNLGVNDIKYHASLLENISKLSIDLLLDYDYYKDFIFKGQFRSVDYDDKLRMLGYEIEDDYWHNVRKPSRDTVIMNVFLSCLYNSLVEIMNDHCQKITFDSNDNFENVLVEDQDLQAENKLITEIKTSKEMKNSTTFAENCNKFDINETECETNKLEYPESFTDLEEQIFIDDKSQMCTGKLDNSHLIDEINIRGEIEKLNINNCDKFESLETQSTKNEIFTVSKTEIDEFVNLVDESPFCDKQIEPNNKQCSTRPVAKITENSYKRKLSNNNINDDIERSEIDRVYLINEVNISGKNEKLNATSSIKLEPMETHNGKDETTSKNLKIFHDILNKNRNQWICKTCECLNPFNVVNCQACDSHCKNNGYWICCHCTFVNEMSNDICSACNTNNELIVLANKWKCWKPVCKVLNDNKFRFCHKCGLQRTRPIVFSDLIEQKVLGKIVKLWICEKCWQFNNDIFKCCLRKSCGEPRFKQTTEITDKTNMKTGSIDLNRNEERNILRNSEIILDNSCSILNENNEGKIEITRENHLNIDWICKKCSLQNVNGNNKCSCESLNVETEWKCWNKNCERMNKIEHNYCQTCKLDKNPPDPETQLVKCYIDNNIREIWICGKCKKYNPKDTAKCEGKNCDYSRCNTIKDDKNKAENPNEIKTNSCQWECDKCAFINNHNEERCLVCTTKINHRSNSDKNDNSPTSSSWKCWFVKCKKSNDSQYEFCQFCKLDRFGCRNRGSRIQCRNRNSIKYVWICQKCSKFNSLSNEVCGGKTCENSRF